MAKYHFCRAGWTTRKRNQNAGVRKYRILKSWLEALQPKTGGRSMPIQKILLARPRGFCAGVVRAVEIVKRALEILPPPIYVFHEIVHNRYVVESLLKKGAVFVEEIQQIPDGAVCIFSAHGVSPEMRHVALQKKLRTF